MILILIKQRILIKPLNIDTNQKVNTLVII